MRVDVNKILCELPDSVPEESTDRWWDKRREEHINKVNKADFEAAALRISAAGHLGVTQQWSVLIWVDFIRGLLLLVPVLVQGLLYAVVFADYNHFFICCFFWNFFFGRFWLDSFQFNVYESHCLQVILNMSIILTIPPGIDAKLTFFQIRLFSEWFFSYFLWWSGTDYSLEVFDRQLIISYNLIQILKIKFLKIILCNDTKISKRRNMWILNFKVMWIEKL